MKMILQLVRMSISLILMFNGHKIRSLKCSISFGRYFESNNNYNVSLYRFVLGLRVIKVHLR